MQETFIMRRIYTINECKMKEMSHEAAKNLDSARGVLLRYSRKRQRGYAGYEPRRNACGDFDTEQGAANAV